MENWPMAMYWVERGGDGSLRIGVWAGGVAPSGLEPGPGANRGRQIVSWTAGVQ